MRLIDADKIDFSKLSCCGFIDEQPVENLEKFIADQPTVEAEPVAYAHRIMRICGNGWNEWIVARCSRCGKEIDNAPHDPPIYDRCPYCGAHMRPRREPK